jgi:superfamily II DNA or RNA helicase/SOS-response transcriptional repressor LexA
VALPPGESELGPLPDAVNPHEVQEAALAALRATREAGRRRALVVLATGLGKTWLASFDYAQLWDELGHQPRLLFIAHRREILRQAARTCRRLVYDRGGDARIAWFLEEHASLDAHLVFASVAKLSRLAYAQRLQNTAFDYVVVDEVHHATAESYGRILRRVDPTFLLGLTATPDRADAADVLGLFDDNEVYRADIGAGISVGRLVPFRYFGVRDDIDYDNIPWRNQRFDPEMLATAAQTEARMLTLWKAWTTHPGRRTLVFCCTVNHTDFVAHWLTEQGVRVRKVYAAPGSDDRDVALEELARGDVDAVCAVDVFNEGVDVPGVDRVVMLRPTESSVVFLQQLGRGLRSADDKSFLTVVDFVGNHHMFLDRLRTLLSLGTDEPAAALGRLLASGTLDLPDGCAVELELEAKPMLEARYRTGGADEVERAYRQLRAMRGTRPTAGELLRMGYLPSTVQKRHGSWFGFVRAEGDLDDTQRAAVDAGGSFLAELETTELSKSDRLLTLRVLVDHQALHEGLTVRELAAGAWVLLRRSPELLRDVPEDQQPPEEPDEDALRRWASYWRSNPVHEWTSPKMGKRAWFRIDEHDRLRLTLVLHPDWATAFAHLVDELVDYRLAQYRRRSGSSVSNGFVCKVTWNRRDPVLELPSRATTAVPEGETDVRLPDGSVWQFRFAAEFCNVARAVGSPNNQLPDLLRRWFGPWLTPPPRGAKPIPGVSGFAADRAPLPLSALPAVASVRPTSSDEPSLPLVGAGSRAGQPGTAFAVRFTASPNGLWVEPVQNNVVSLLPRQGVVAYPDVRAAAGHASREIDTPDAERVWLPLEANAPDLFAVRVDGTSMDGGKAPLRDGDWAIFRLARGAPGSAVTRRVVLVQIPGISGSMYLIKRVEPDGSGWRLISDNPDGPTFRADEDMVVIAKLDRVVRPEELAPPVRTVLSADDLAEAFGLDALRPISGMWSGHRFVFVDQKGLLAAPDRLRLPGRQRPGETVYALARGEHGFVYLGVGRWCDPEGLWQIPEVDYPTWRAWGEGREVSRTLPPGALARAQALADVLLRLPESERRLVGSQGRSARIVDSAHRGGLRLDVGAASERTISLTDLAWVAVASDSVGIDGGLLDEARVNRLRYLDGTPKGSTRWIDTGWALAAWELGRGLRPEGVEGPDRSGG